MNCLCNDYSFFTNGTYNFSEVLRSRNCIQKLLPAQSAGLELRSYQLISTSMTLSHLADLAPYSSLLGKHKAQVRRNETTEAKHANFHEQVNTSQWRQELPSEGRNFTSKIPAKSCVSFKYGELPKVPCFINRMTASDILDTTQVEGAIFQAATHQNSVYFKQQLFRSE